MNQYRTPSHPKGMAQRSGQGFSMLASGLGGAFDRLVSRLLPQHINAAIRRYQLAHRRQSIEGLEKLVQQPISTIFIVLVLGVTLALPAGSVLVFAKAWYLSQVFQPQPRAVVYFESQTSLADVNRMALSWQHLTGVSETQVIDRDMGMQLYMSSSGIDPELVMGLEENPLPHVVRVVLDSWSQEAALAVQSQIQAQAGVDWVQLDLLWLQRFQALRELSTHFLWLLVWSLGAVAVLIVANTVKLAIEHRRQDIVVAKLVGATNGFVRRPFLYMGFVLGLLGGLCALVFLKLCAVYLSAPFGQLLSAYSLNDQPFAWQGLLICAVLGGAALLGWLGAWFAARRHLAAIEPT